MKKIIRLTEQDLARIVKRVIMEQESSDLIGKSFNFYKTNDEREENIWFQDEITNIIYNQSGNIVFISTKKGYNAMKLSCTDLSGAFLGSTGNKLFNKKLYDTIKKQYCTSKR